MATTTEDAFIPEADEAPGRFRSLASAEPRLCARLFMEIRRYRVEVLNGTAKGEDLVDLQKLIRQKSYFELARDIFPELQFQEEAKDCKDPTIMALVDNAYRSFGMPDHQKLPLASNVAFAQAIQMMEGEWTPRVSLCLRLSIPGAIGRRSNES